MKEISESSGVCCRHIFDHKGRRHRVRTDHATVAYSAVPTIVVQAGVDQTASLNHALPLSRVGQMRVQRPEGNTIQGSTQSDWLHAKRPYTRPPAAVGCTTPPRRRSVHVFVGVVRVRLLSSGAGRPTARPRSDQGG